jgi:hypothetical protein
MVLALRRHGISKCDSVERIGAANDERRTANDERRTTNDERRTTDEGVSFDC